MKTITLLAMCGLAAPFVFAQTSIPSQTAPGMETPSQTQPGTAPYPSSGGSNGMRSEASAEQRPAPSPVAQLKPETQNDVTYLCGGVGEEESAFMKKQARDYDMMLTFAARNGAYLADVDVDIRDTKGNQVLQTKCDAPILLVDLPTSGNYRVCADAAGYTLNRTVKVTAGKRKGQSLAAAVLSWPQQVAEAPATTDTSSGAGSSGNSDTDNNSAR